MSEQKSANREQVTLQCKAVLHMLAAIGGVYNQMQATLESGDGGESFVDMVGKQSFVLMEDLGDWMNGMDIVTDADDWLTPVFHRAQELWSLRARSTGSDQNG